MALSVPFSRPLQPASADNESIWRRINWSWWLMRAPMVVLAIPAAWGVGSFASERLPWFVSIFSGLGFEATYIGAIALAEQQHDSKDRFSVWLWWALNVMAVISSIITNTLFFAGGRYVNITWEAVTHGAPLSLLAFMYGLSLHNAASKAARVVVCDVCGRSFPGIDSYNGHKRTCKLTP